MFKRLIPTAFGIIAVAPSVQAAVIQATQLTDANTLELVDNSSASLTRREDEIELDLFTQNLLPGAYTVWWTIYNDASLCVNGCDDDDESRPGVNATALNATGGIVDESGIGNFTALLPENFLPEPEQVIFGPGLLDSFGSEIQLSVRWHGPVNPPLLEEQLTTFNGGCSTTPGDGLFDSCETLQRATFQATSVPESSPSIGLIALVALGTGIAFKRRY